MVPRNNTAPNVPVPLPTRRLAVAQRVFWYRAPPFTDHALAARALMPSITRKLATLACDVAYSKLQASTIIAAKRAILDALGCAVAAIGCEPAQIASRVLAKGAADVTVIGERGRASLERAVLVNGILVRYLDMMDVYWDKDVCHPAENIPLALACVESVNGSGKAFIEAVVAGYEAQMRLTHALSLQSRGMHHVTAAGIVAPLVIGKAWSLEPDVIEHAVALGGCRQFTLHALSKGGLSMAKAIGYPWSAMSSILAIRLAREGFTGPVHFLDWFSETGADAGTCDRSALEHDGTYLIERVSFKQFPVQFELQTPVEIALRLRDRIKSAADIEAIEIDVPPVAMGRVADPAKFAPENRETADHSLPVCVAMALLDGKLTAQQFESGRWGAADIASIVSRIKVAPVTELAECYPHGRPAEIRVRLANGESLSDFQDVPTGDSERPMDDIAIDRKFMANAEEKIGRSHAREIVECVKRLETVNRVEELTHMLAAT